MALTTAQFQAWLESSAAIRCLLVEVVVNINGVETTLYLSNRNYNTGPNEMPANTSYQPWVQTSLTFNQTLPLDGSATLSYGDLAIDNTNGIRDEWLTYIWANREINIYMGDITFPRADFTKIYSGYVSDIASSGRNSLNISIRDLLQRLNTPITSTLVGGIDQNKEQLRPLVFGEVHNITPIVVSSSNLVYMVHNGPIERIIEVRDNGIPLTLTTGYTVNLSAGTFTLLKAPTGIITCSVQGESSSVDLATGAIVSSSYSNTVAKLIATIVRKYGLSPLSASNIDLEGFNNFNINNAAPVGVYLTSNTNVISVCQDLASSVGAQFTSNKQGLVTLVKLDIPADNGSVRSITDTDIMLGTFSISQKVPVQGAIKLGYCKNWTVQTQLLTGIPETHKTMLGLEYITYTATDVAVLSKYNLSAEPIIKNTYLVSNTPTAYVTAEANRLLTLWSAPRFVYKLEGTAKFLTLNLGDMVKVTHYRFGLQNSKYGQVVSVALNWDTGRVNLGVLV